MYTDNIVDGVPGNCGRGDNGGRRNFGNRGRPWMNGPYRGRHGPGRFYPGPRFESWKSAPSCFPPPPPPPPPPPVGPNPPNPELWVEAKTDRGKSYYYHSRTRETTWTRPLENPMCRVVTHEQMEEMASNGDVPPDMLDAPHNGSGAIHRIPVAVPPPDFAQPPPWIGQELPHKDSNLTSYSNGSTEQIPHFAPPPRGWNGHDGAAHQPSVSNREENANYSDASGFSQPPPSAANGYQWGHMSSWAGWATAPNSCQPGVHTMPSTNATLPQAMISQLQTHTSPPQAPGLPPVYCDNRQPQPKAQPYQPPWPSQPATKPSTQPPAQTQTQLASANIQDKKECNEGSNATVERPIAICRPIRPKKAKTKISEELKALAEEWTTHKSPDGHSYYYHAKDKISVWVKPQPLREYEELKARIAREEAEEERIYKNIKIVDVIDLEEITESEPPKTEDDEKKEKERLDIESFYETLQKEEKEREAKEREEKERQEREVAEQEKKIREDKEREDKEREEKLKKEQEEKEKEKQEKEQQMEKEAKEKEKQEKERQEKEKERKDKKRKKKEEMTKEDWNKPFMNLPVPGTPWLIVWTVSGGRFFFNSAASHAVWLRPTELADRRDVDLMVARPPPAVLRAKEKYAAAMAAKEAGKPIEDTDSNNENAETSDKPVDDAKKRRTCSTEDSITDAYADTPLAEKQQIFRQMLIDNKVSSLTNWEKELHKIIFDSRYKLLTNEQRKIVYEKFVQERSAEEKKERDIKEAAFRQLMEEVRPHSNTSYQDFAKTYGEDARFTDVDKRSQSYFDVYMADVRRKELKREKAKQDFIAMLKEKTIDRHTRWVDVKKKIESDVRYKVVVSNTAREEYFKEYCKIAREERKKDKDRASTSNKKDVKKTKKDKESEDDSTKERSSEERLKPRQAYSVKQLDSLKQGLVQLLRETRSITHRSFAAVKNNPDALKTIHELLEHDWRYQALKELPVQRERTIMKYLEELQLKGPSVMPP